VDLADESPLAAADHAEPKAPRRPRQAGVGDVGGVEAAFGVIRGHGIACTWLAAPNITPARLSRKTTVRIDRHDRLGANAICTYNIAIREFAGATATSRLLDQRSFSPDAVIASSTLSKTPFIVGGSSGHRSHQSGRRRRPPPAADRSNKSAAVSPITVKNRDNRLSHATLLNLLIRLAANVLSFQ
jgi:hypothetical protein